MLYRTFCGLLLFVSAVFSFSYDQSFGLTESVELFGEINSIDLVLYDIWIEPENPQNGEGISVYGSVYNAGVIPSGDFTDAITVGYFVNDDLAEIDILKNVLPGVENGVEISSGPIFDAVPGIYTVTVIINYHDTLSHLRDNLENNIIQKKFQISDAGVPSLLQYELYQHYDESTNVQQIKILGSVSGISQNKIEQRTVVVDVGELQKHVKTNSNGKFSLDLSVGFSDMPITVTAYVESDPNASPLSKQIFPLKLEKDQTALALDISGDDNILGDDVRNTDVVVVLFQDSYENLFKKISLGNLDQQSQLVGNSVLTNLPGNHDYIGEIYFEGRFVDSFQSYFPVDAVVNKDLFISESAKIKFLVYDGEGKPENNVVVDVWNYRGISGGDGFTDWIDVLPTLSANDPYAAKATFPGGHVVWSDDFLIGADERKVVSISLDGVKR